MGIYGFSQTTIKNVENCPLFSVKQKIFQKKTIAFLVVKSRNYNWGDIKHVVVKVYCKVCPNRKVYPFIYYGKDIVMTCQGDNDKFVTASSSARFF